MEDVILRQTCDVVRWPLAPGRPRRLASNSFSILPSNHCCREYNFVGYNK